MGSGLRLRLSRAGNGRPVLAVASWAACLPIAWVAFWVLVDPVAPSGRFTRGLALGLLVLTVVALPLAVVVARPLVAWLEERTVVRRVAGVVALIGLFALQVRVGLAVRFPPGWDAGQIEEWAHGMANGYHTPADWEWMINVYPNNSLLVSLLTRWFELGRAIGIDGAATGVVLLNALVMTSSVAVAYAVARRVTGPAAAYLVAGLAVPLIGISPWIGVAYSDTLGMIFPILVFYLFLRLGDALSTPARAACLLAIGLLGYVGYCIKPTAVFAVVAVVLVSALRGAWRDWSLSATVRRVSAGVALVGGLATSMALVGQVNAGVGAAPTGEEKDQAIPFTHFLMMGAQKSNGAWGNYLLEDVTMTVSLPPEERFDNGIDVYQRRVAEMGPRGYAVFLHEKGNWVFGDGTFAAFSEGEMSSPGTPWDSTDDLSRSIRTWFNPNGEHFGRLALTWHVVWLAILVYVALPAIWWSRGIFSSELTAMRLSLLALLAFLLLFEARSRYLYLYLPVFMVLATAAVVAVATALRRQTRAP